jgi:hypothetical protein
MPAKPDRFDLAVRKYKDKSPEEQIEGLTGLLFGLNDWLFWNQGDEKRPDPTVIDMDNENHLLVFSNVEKLADFTEEAGQRTEKDPLSYFTVPSDRAVEYCLQFSGTECNTILVNIGSEAFTVPFDLLQQCFEDWQRSGGKKGRGYRGQNTTTEEDDFWEDNGL